MSRSAIVALIGSKGGTGKTTLSHALCEGLGLRGIPSVLLSTDPDSLEYEPGRKYSTRIVKSDSDMHAVIDWFSNLAADTDKILVIDGVARSHQLDKVLVDIAELAYLPFVVGRGSDDALFRLTLDLAALPTAYALPNAWPTNKFEAECLDRALYDKGLFDGPYAGRIVEPINRISTLTEVTAFEPVPLSIEARIQCKRLADKTLELLGWRSA